MGRVLLFPQRPARQPLAGLLERAWYGYQLLLGAGAILCLTNALLALVWTTFRP